MTEPGQAGAGGSVDELVAIVQAALADLAARPDPAAFQALLGLSQSCGEAIGISAQSLSGAMSWARIGELAGTSRQNAWARWSGG